jgi:hypothetical protein
MQESTMETETRAQIRNHLDGVNVPMIERYASVGIGLAATGIGVAASILGPRRGGMILGSVVAAAGLALIARGVTGHCPVTRALARRAEHAADPGAVQPVDEALFGGDNQGEGDRRSARSYNEHVRDFIEDDRVEPAARAAASAIDGPDGPGLRAAEEAGKAPINRGPL